MYIPNSIQKSVKVPGFSVAKVDSHILTYKGIDYKITSVTKDGIIVEDVADNGAVIDRLFTWDLIQ